MQTLETLSFDNTFARLPEKFFRRVRPTPLPAPRLVAFNERAAELVNLDPNEAQRADFAEYFAGNKLLPGSEPLAAIYAGHQFGTFVPQLGDGRAILLGEAVNARGERFDIQLKGAGETAFSRMGDGRAVLRSTIREYLCSEAMHALGIPTTRALCIVGADEPVYRESVETAAVLTRLAQTHVRFGSFELFASRAQDAELKTLADYTIENHFAHLAGKSDKYLQFLREVIERTARLIARWQAVGFAHGVMNTDNMSIIGLTIDYGPFGFLDEYDAGFICNHSDYSGRYAFNRQPQIGLWNLGCLGGALLPLVTREAAVNALDEYQAIYAEEYLALMRAKLGFQTEQPEDVALIQSLLELLQANRIDYTMFFRRLCDFKIESAARDWNLAGMFVDPQQFDDWANDYRARLNAEKSVDAERAGKMRAANPKYILRNHLAQAAIEAAENGDYSEIEKLRRILQNPFADQNVGEHYAEPPAPGSKRVAVSCSS